MPLCKKTKSSEYYGDDVDIYAKRAHKSDFPGTWFFRPPPPFLMKGHGSFPTLQLFLHSFSAAVEMLSLLKAKSWWRGGCTLIYFSGFTTELIECACWVVLHFNHARLGTVAGDIKTAYHNHSINLSISLLWRAAIKIQLTTCRGVKKSCYRERYFCKIDIWKVGLGPFVKMISSLSLRGHFA